MGLIGGALVRIAAFFGSLMHINEALAGSASSDPLLFALHGARPWKVTSYVGFDRVPLPALGTPWQPRSTLRRAVTPRR